MRGRGTIAATLPALVAGTFLYAATVAVAGHPWRPGLVLEFGILLYVSAVLGVVQRRRALASVLATLFFLAVYAVCFGSYVVYRETLRWSALAELDELLRVVPAPWVAVAVLLGVGLAVPFVANLRPPRAWREWLTLAPLAVLATCVAVAPGGVVTVLDALRPRVVERRDLEATRNGPFFSLLHDVAATRDVRRRLGVADVGAPGALDAEALARALVDRARRSVHLIVMESLVDPLDFSAVGLRFDPVDPRLRRWLRETRSLALSPAIGGRTARAEFELLCGAPSYEAFGLDFDHLRAPVPCLPRLLGAHGYLTIASVPVVPQFFQAGRAYRAMGFARRYFEDAFDMTDREGEWLANGALFRQVLAHVGDDLDRGTPLLDYVVTVDGHVPFVLGPSRPPVLEGDGWVTRLANAVHYTSAAVAAFVETLERRDPDAVVVIVGDHLPVLGLDYDAYTRAGYRPARGGAAPPRDPGRPVSTFELRATPLIVRRAGRPVPVGVVPSFAVPEIILDQLTDGGYCERVDCVHAHTIVPRPDGQDTVFTTTARYPERVCDEGAGARPDCAAARQRERRLRARYRALLRQGVATAPGAAPR